MWKLLQKSDCQSCPCCRHLVSHLIHRGGWCPCCSSWSHRGTETPQKSPGFPQAVQAIGSCFLFTERYNEWKVNQIENMNENRNQGLISTAIYDTAAGEIDAFLSYQRPWKLTHFLLALASFLGYCFSSIRNSYNSYNSCKMWILGWLCWALGVERRKAYALDGEENKPRKNSSKMGGCVPRFEQCSGQWKAAERTVTFSGLWSVSDTRGWKVQRWHLDTCWGPRTSWMWKPWWHSLLYVIQIPVPRKVLLSVFITGGWTG